jgi:hypothetical protein
LGERLSLWQRTYEARVFRGREEMIARAKTPEAAKALLVKRCFVENPTLTDTGIEIEVRGDSIIVTQPSSRFVAVYTKPTNQSQLILKRRTDTEDHLLLAQAWQAVVAKARELGWIV